MGLLIDLRSFEARRLDIKTNVAIRAESKYGHIVVPFNEKSRT